MWGDPAGSSERSARRWDGLLAAERLFAFDNNPAHGPFLHQPDIPGGLGEDGERGTERCFGTRGIDSGGEETTLHAGAPSHLDLLDDRVVVRPYEDLVQGLV